MPTSNTTYARGDRVRLVQVAGAFLGPSAQATWGLKVGMEGTVIEVWDSPPFLAVRFDDAKIDGTFDLPPYYVEKVTVTTADIT